MAAQSAGEAMRGESVMLDDVYAAEIQRLVALGTRSPATAPRVKTLLTTPSSGLSSASAAIPTTCVGPRGRCCAPWWSGSRCSAAAPGARAAPSRTRVAAGAE